MQHDMHQKRTMKQAHYGRLLLMVVLSFIAMYILMYAMGVSEDRIALMTSRSDGTTGNAVERSHSHGGIHAIQTAQKYSPEYLLNDFSG
jgi:uncharacterized membrane protein